MPVTFTPGGGVRVGWQRLTVGANSVFLGRESRESVRHVGGGSHCAGVRALPGIFPQTDGAKPPRTSIPAPGTLPLCHLAVTPRAARHVAPVPPGGGHGAFRCCPGRRQRQPRPGPVRSDPVGRRAASARRRRVLRASEGSTRHLRLAFARVAWCQRTCEHGRPALFRTWGTAVLAGGM